MWLLRLHVTVQLSALLHRHKQQRLHLNFLALPQCFIWLGWSCFHQYVLCRWEWTDPLALFFSETTRRCRDVQSFGSWRHLAAQIHCFFWAFWEHIIKISLNHLFSWISCSRCIAIGCVLISYIFRNGCFIVSSFLFCVLLADIVKGRSVSGWPCCTISEPQRAKRMIHRASRGGKKD